MYSDETKLHSEPVIKIAEELKSINPNLKNEIQKLLPPVGTQRYTNQVRNRISYSLICVEM